MNFNTIVIIFIIIVIIIIVYSIWKSVSVDNKKANPDVPTKCTGTNCKVDCNVLSPLTIKRCEDTEDGKKICNNCKCDASGRFSGCMECKESNPSKPELKYSIKVPKKSCTDPFQWNGDDITGTCDLGPGFFCLPANISPIDCNPYTGRQLLTFDPTNNVYGWSCVCKDSTKFSGGICNNINVCGMEGSIQNPDNSNTGRGLVNISNKNDYWSNTSDWDPLAMDNSGNYINSACSCRSNESADNKNLLCLPDNCYPGSVSSVSSDNCDCNCPGCTGLVDCKAISSSYDPQTQLTYYNSVCKIPSCVPDPCGGPNGTYGKYMQTGDNTWGCVCNDGYNLVPDPSYYGGFRCAKLCQDDSICAERGTCVVKSLNSVYTNFTVVCKDQDQVNGNCGGSGLFFIKYKLNDKTYYLNYNKDNKKISLDLTQNPESYFSFKIRSCDSKYTDGSCKYIISDKIITSGLISGNFYYLMIGNQYLTFNNDINIHNLVNDDDKEREKSLFLFSSTVGNKIPYPTIDGTIFFDSIKRYLSGSKTDPPSLLYESSSKTLEQCDPCKNGYVQDPSDPTQRCLRKCSPSGSYFQSEDKWTENQINQICCNGGTQTYHYRAFPPNYYQVDCN